MQYVSTRCFAAFILVSIVCFCITAILCPRNMFQTLLPIAAACLSAKSTGILWRPEE